ncbi:transketolase [Sediminivirga luteola]|jgi:transketolase|uniref:Transketolase n=2 Tax=Sediminivirga luteola TaxID=1774748 RepID=A0A8J2U042_9MICO|nr:transketolase [Sediminivirga luteola]
MLAADAVQRAGHGHPGTAMSLAPAAYLLYQKVMRHSPANPQWLGRDRFVLSAGHSSLTQYIQLFLAGYRLELDDLKALRTWGSLTPGHPEVGHTDGVEITTGPLGSGLASAVGFAFAARRERGLFDPHTPAGESPFDHTVFVIASDGDLQEGVSGEASSLAGTQRLSDLVVIWDDNRISIEDDTSIAFTEDVEARYRAYGWHVEHVDFTQGGTEYHEDVEALHAAIERGRARTDAPTFIRLSTIIAWPAPNARGTGGSHGAALGADEVRATKELLGFDPDEDFAVAEEVLAHTRAARERGQVLEQSWLERFDSWKAAEPERAALLERLRAGQLPEAELEAALPEFAPDEEKGVATRAASGKVLNAIGPVLPELWGGSADLAGSNNTIISADESFLPEDRSSAKFKGNPYGRNLHFGVREFAAGLIANGIALHGPTLPYAATFLVFSDYQRAAVRLAALQELPVTFVWTHDSIGLGEDGPTHQPVEHLSALRAIPNLDVVRPADANETAHAWLTVLRHRDRPAGLALTRQAVPVLDRSEGSGLAPASLASRGAYVLKDPEGTPDVVLLASGSEVAIALAGQRILAAEGIAARVVSVPCQEWFDAQDEEYRESVLPRQLRARVSVEAGSAQSWHRYTGSFGRNVSLEHFGASADYQRLYTEFGITPEAVAQAARESIADVKEFAK